MKSWNKEENSPSTENSLSLLSKILTPPSKKNSIKYLTNKALLMPMLDKMLNQLNWLKKKNMKLWQDFKKL